MSNKYLSPSSSQKTYWFELWSNSPLFALPSCKHSSIQTLKRFAWSSVQFSHSVMSDSFVSPWVTAHQASLSITNSRSSPKLMCIESVMPSSYLILCRSLLLLPPIPPSIRVFSNESTLHVRWPKYWSFSFSIIPSKVLLLRIIYKLMALTFCFMLIGS